MPRLRIAFNASAVPPRPAGAGIYTVELARALRERDDLEMLVAAPQHSGLKGRWLTPTSAAARLTWEQASLPRLIREAEAEVYHGPHFSLPLKSPVPRVVTVHDLAFFRIPRRYDRMHRWYYRGLARLANRAERVIVPSAAVARDVVRFLKYPVERIRVIAEGPRKGFAPASESEVVAVRQRLGIAGAYVLMVGTSEPGKRAIDGIRAMALLKEERQELSLVLAGNAGRLEPALKREVRKLGLEGRVVFTGYVDDYQLAALYTGSVALLYLSIYEGFGLPPLEAMACATPVIAACRPAMDEVLQGAARFVTAGDSRAVADEIRAMLVGEQRMIVAERGLEHARKFSWEQAAEETAAVYREVVR